MTEARKLAIDRIKEGRARKGNEALQRKENDAKILEKSRKELENKKTNTKQVIVYDSGSSSKVENQVVFRRKRKTVKSPAAVEEKEEIVVQPGTFRLKRLE
jgi:type II secretory pathway component PulC